MHNLIIDYIKAHQSAVTEYQLLSYLQKERPDFFNSCGKPPTLYKKHFKLTNLLYNIDKELRLIGFRLEISLIEIKLLRSVEARGAIREFDDLREFYLNEANFELSEEAISEMLADFWRRYNQRQDLSEYLNILEIKTEGSVDLELIKRQYSKLALANHPDRGGSNELFRKIHQAYQVLKSHY